MKAIVIGEPGGPEVLELREVPAPEPGAREIRMRVQAAGVNRADLLQRRGRYPAPPGVAPDIPGLEYAGVVERVGAGVTAWRPGDRVMGLVGGGAYAEAVVVHEDEALPIPARLSAEEAAAVPEAFITAHDALFTLLGVGAGDRVLIHAIGSGVGTAALQLAHTAGAVTFGTSRHAWKLERGAGLGLDVAIDAGREAFADVVSDRTGAAGVDAVLDLVGGAYLHDNLRALAVRGRMAVVGLVAGRAAELDLGLLLRKRLTLIGTALRSRSLDEKIAATRAFRDTGLPLLEAGRVRPVLDRVYPMDAAADAHRRMEANENFGKIVLRWNPDGQRPEDVPAA
ncbi:MAG TPA: NAD(P)H-quinone oxidoreductase [Longimicrobiales bacterium]